MNLTVSNLELVGRRHLDPHLIRIIVTPDTALTIAIIGCHLLHLSFQRTIVDITRSMTFPGENIAYHGTPTPTRIQRTFHPITAIDLSQLETGLQEAMP